MKAELLAVGSELLDPERLETNSAYLTARLGEAGVEVFVRAVVADDLAWLTTAFQAALARADIVISTGGLGPTEDDLTRDAAAAAVGRPLQRRADMVEALRARFARYGRTMAPVNEKQADVIEGATVLPNPRGTAPGQRLEDRGRLLVLLPGPPAEMQPIFDDQVLPLVRERAGGRVVRRRELRIAGMGESDVEQVVAPIYTTFTNPRTTILGGPGETELHLVAQGASPAEAEERLEALGSALRARLQGALYSEDGRRLHEVVAALLLERRLTLAVAESCTGGKLAARLTDIPGSSAFLDRGYVTYSNQAKADMLGVDPALFETVGAVSAETAQAMAAGARRASGADLAIAITGIAGPGGGTPEKPVGLVYLATAGAAGERVRRVHFPGDRNRVRHQAVTAALDMIRRGLLGIDPP
ncbi:MAG TPA: competence/damage-inducible protein A [Vicinamibacteria bacterium]